MSRSDTSIKTYGGKLSDKELRVLEKMNGELHNSKKILYAQPDRILFIDKSEDLKEYSYAYGTLWFNNYPVIGDVRAFHFEYRDEASNFLTLSGKNLSTIETIGYMIRVTLDDKDVLASSRVKISPASLIQRSKDREKVYYAGVSMN